jgi:RNA polymerase sigma-70 factor (ECF subfamily)
MDPENERWAAEIEKHRPLLNVLARQNVNPRLWKDVDPSGVVQNTMAEAVDKRGQFEGGGPMALKGWLRRILLNNLYDEIRKVHREKRDVDREVSLAGAIDESTCRLQSQLSNHDSTPSMKAMRREEALGLAVALERLEPDQRNAVEFRHLQGRSLAESAALMGKSQSAVAALLHRGMVKLKSFLKEG